METVTSWRGNLVEQQWAHRSGPPLMEFSGQFDAVAQDAEQWTSQAIISGLGTTLEAGG